MKPDLVKRYVDSGRVRLVWHDFAWIGDESRQAAQAAHCAGRQGRFWELHDVLYQYQRGENSGQFAPAGLKSLAAGLPLDQAAFDTCLDRGEDLPTIQRELRDFRAQGVTATPYFLVNGQPRTGGSASQLYQALDADLARLGR